MVLALGMCSISGGAQTKKQPAKRQATTTRSTQQGGQVMKFRQVEEDDGYVWYLLKRGNLYGARDEDGNNIVPIKYDGVSYECFSGNCTRFFCVRKGEYKGAYTRMGTLVISPDRHYEEITLDGNDLGMIFWRVKKKGVKGTIILDAKGREIFTLDCDDASMGAKGDCAYIWFWRGDMFGISDLNGNVVLPLCEIKYPSPYKGNDGSWYVKVNGEEKVNYSDLTKFDYKPYENLFWIKKTSSSSSSSSITSSSTASSSGNSNSNSSNSGGGTTTVVVEHHRDPIPVQEWQACFGCGGMGTMGCDNCGGSGTKYIGDRLHRCSRCNGQGIIPCNICYGSKGKYVTVYR